VKGSNAAAFVRGGDAALGASSVLNGRAVFAKHSLALAQRQQGRQVQEVGFPHPDEVSAARLVCISAARKIGVPLVGAPGMDSLSDLMRGTEQRDAR